MYYLLAETIPSGYFQLPIWTLVTILSLLVSFISYIWHKMDKAVEKNISSIEKVKDTAQLAGEASAKSEKQIQIDTGRLDKLESAWEDSVREELSKGGYVTMEKMSEIRQQITDDMKKVFSEKLEASEKNLSLLIENTRLSLIANGKAKRIIKKK